MYPASTFVFQKYTIQKKIKINKLINNRILYGGCCVLVVYESWVGITLPQREV